MPTNNGLLIHGALAVIVFCVFYFFIQSSPRTGIPMALFYLAILSGMRRWTIPMWGWVDNDPLLLVVPLLVICFFIASINKRGLPLDTRLAKMILALLCLMLLQMFNPAQGGLTVGIAGALFYVIPLLWYYVGRAKGTPSTIQNILFAVVGIAIVSSLWGLYQLYFGFTASESAWIQITNYNQQVGSTQRPFSIFPSPAEYGQFLGMGIVILWAACLRGKLLAFLPIPLLGIALFLLGIRGFLATTLVTCAVLWAVQGKSSKMWIFRGVFAIIIGVIGMRWSLSEVKPSNMASGVQQLAQHQVNGLLDPASDSSSGAHSNLLTTYIVSGFTRPLGLGLGSTTLAASKYGGIGASSEVDLSNLFVSLGCVGGLLYTALICWVLFTLFQHWRYTRHFFALSLLGISLLALGQWLNGGHYAASMLSMFCIGALDRIHQQVLKNVQMRRRSAPTRSPRLAVAGSAPRPASQSPTTR